MAHLKKFGWPDQFLALPSLFIGTKMMLKMLQENATALKCAVEEFELQ